MPLQGKGKSSSWNTFNNACNTICCQYIAEICPEMHSNEMHMFFMIDITVSASPNPDLNTTITRMAKSHKFHKICSQMKNSENCSCVQSWT